MRVDDSGCENLSCFVQRCLRTHLDRSRSLCLDPLEASAAGAGMCSIDHLIRIKGWKRSEYHAGFFNFPPLHWRS